MSSIKVFSFKGKQVRTEQFGGDVWFCVRDVGDILGLVRASETCRKYLRRDELRTFLSSVKSMNKELHTAQRGMEDENTGGNCVHRHMLFTNESGVYTMILRSEKREAQEFRYWVTHEVLPSIRRTGSYSLPLLSGSTIDTTPVPLTMSGNLVSGAVSFTYSAVFNEEAAASRITAIREKIGELIDEVRECNKS
mgnify:CR=1 FL=1